jgi:ankyrin repeat protein
MPNQSLQLFDAVQMRDVARAQYLLEKGRERHASSRLQPLKQEDFPVVRDEDLMRLDHLLRHGLDPDSPVMPGFADSLMLSFFLTKRNSRAACMLIEHGANVHTLLAVAGWKLPALHAAAQAGLEDVVWLLLLDGADPNQVVESRSALFLAARHDSPSVTRTLLEAGAHVDAGLASETPLMTAAEKGRIATVDLLLAHGANVNARSRSGWTALHHAAWSNHQAIARKLLDAGADPLARDNSGLNATDHATKSFDPICAQVFRDRGIPDIYSHEPVDDAWRPSRGFDYFISYRHGLYSQQATDLANALRMSGVTPFLDKELLNLPQAESVSDALIKDRLVKALALSRTTLFFETYREMRDAPGFSWQFFELLNSRDALLISFDSQLVRRWIIEPGKRVSTSAALFAFESIDELASALVARARD